MKARLGGVGLLAGGHVDETETTGFAGVRVAHDAASVDIAVLLEKTADLLLGQTGVDAGNEKVGARVGGFFFVLTDLLGSARWMVNDMLRVDG